MEMDDHEKAKRKNDSAKAKLPQRTLSPGMAFMLTLMAALAMGIIILVVLETTWSPPPYPADRLVYNSGSTRYALDLRTGEKTMLGMADEGRDVLSPDGRWWARWVVDGELGNSWLVLKDAVTGKTQTPIEQRFYGTGVRVNWSPDSQWILFHASPELGSSASAFELWRVNVQTGVLERLTNNTAFDSDPDLSPDGARIVYSSDAEAPSELHILTLATGETRRLVGIEGYAPRWSPDGLRVVFATKSYETGPLWIVRADGTGAERVVQEAWYWNFGWEK
jgi:dipeptidyl aminopeptidase/acylaminoacyl peptidase